MKKKRIGNKNSKIREQIKEMLISKTGKYLQLNSGTSLFKSSKTSTNYVYVITTQRHWDVDKEIEFEIYLFSVDGDLSESFCTSSLCIISSFLRRNEFAFELIRLSIDSFRYPKSIEKYRFDISKKYSLPIHRYSDFSFFQARWKRRTENVEIYSRKER